MAASRVPASSYIRAQPIATDGFESYGAVIQRLIGPGCVYGQVVKTRRNDRVVRVERRVTIGTAMQPKDALVQSEDSEHLNTSFVERLNLTIRQGLAYVRRCSPCHARCKAQLRGHVELLQSLQLHRGMATIRGKLGHFSETSTNSDKKRGL